MYKYILSIHSFANSQTGASILRFKNNQEPEIVSISEERLIRKKYPYTFPLHSILNCMNYFSITNLKKIDLIVSDWIRLPRWLRSGPSYNYTEFDYIKEKLNFDKKKIIQINHHLAHAASTYYTSKFKSSSILIVDGNGSDVETSTYFKAKNNKIIFLENYKNHGIGSAYSAVTGEILNLGSGGEGKTMGLAPYGKRNKKIKIFYKQEGIKTDFSNFMLRMPYSDVLSQDNKNFRPHILRKRILPANKKNILKYPYVDWAFEIQRICENIMINLGKDLFNKTKNKRLCLAGGVALNSVANEKLFLNTNFKDMHIFPACDDSGIHYGCVLWAYHNIFNQKKRVNFKNAYWGLEYSKKYTQNILKKFKIKYSTVEPEQIGKLIADGNVIGVLNGRSEIGPRALGNRSILADARNPKIRDYINKYIKHREVFRPFAPAALKEKSKDYFKLNHSPFMLRVTKSNKSKKIPSVLHVDKTARLQTVDKKDNPYFYKIIKGYEKFTDIPVILNTSFNDAGEPMVESPLDAIITSLKTNLNYVVIEGNLVNLNIINQKNKKILLKKIINFRNLKIKEENKKAIKIITKRYNKKELNRKILLNNKKARYNTLSRPIDKIKKFFKNIKKNKKILIIGTNDHTNILIKLFNNFFKKNNNIFYFEINENDIFFEKKKIKSFKNILSSKYLKNFDTVFISSYQYSNKIFEILNKQNIKPNKVFFPYDNSSRSLIDYYFIKKYSSKKKIYTAKII